MVIPSKNGNPVGVPFWAGMWDLGRNPGYKFETSMLDTEIKKIKYQESELESHTEGHPKVFPLGQLSITQVGPKAQNTINYE